MRQPTLFSGEARLAYDDAIELTIQSMRAYGPEHPHWCIAWSGGKDSSAVLTLIVHLIDVGRIAPPKSLTVFYADTRQELPPLQASAFALMEQLRMRGVPCEVVRAPLDKRFLVYMLGRGVPPPNNNTLRWCTRQIKVDPMAAAISARLDALDGNVLMITGVRQGESAIRDQRIAMSCGKDGAECGQGWYQQVLPQSKGVRGRIATLAPILHWRVCNVWDWLRIYAPMKDYGGWATAAIADAYGGDEAAEIAARTGCIGCPLASQELALETVLTNPDWAHLAPLRRLKPLYRELREPRHRLRKAGAEVLKDGSTAANPQRMGPLTFDARLMALERIEEIQAECNEAAAKRDGPGVDILNSEETTRIRELVAAETWPQGWDGNEPRADTPLDLVFRDGSVQPLML
ncbi:phosphoadenosine phosphosulfate reductase [Jiella endophytica]|uniref:Phosphoadenosine phosphosulfate reductase n=1 Tax=Jiella endophytica TaxID=2558362 RepID=A0A4Y8REV4_9HYPH|nr:phosphoadenosine phosphosulfate reductase family protein [Jiella endophytica]TFF20802.1 phosphoadenosine phosphosulfate reductase [Jiella endophytica]